MKKWLLTALAVLSSAFAFSTHVLGGTIYLQCNDDTLTPLTYEYDITLVILRDPTGAPLGQTTTVNYFGSNTPVGQFTLPSVSMVSIPGPRPYEIHVYRSTVALPVNDFLTVEWLLCCRPPAILNVGNGSNSQNFSFRISTDISTLTSECNGTPIHLAPMSIIWPKGVPFAIAYTAFDAEGDSICYSLDTSRTDLNQVMNYVHPFSTPNGGVQIDSATGLFRYETDSVGSYNIVIRMDAYDSSGVWTSTNRAEMHIEVVNFGGGNLINFNPPSTVVNNTYTFRVGMPDTLVLTASSDGPVLDAEYYVPPNVDPSSVYFDTDLYKQGANVDVNISWDPQSTDVGMEFPMIIRFKGANWNYDYVLQLNGKANNIGLFEEEEPWLSLYPNPSQGEVTLEFDRPVIRVEVINLTGQVMQTREIESTSRQIKLEDLPSAGTYFIRLLSESGEVITRALIVE